MGMDCISKCQIKRAGTEESFIIATSNFTAIKLLSPSLVCSCSFLFSTEIKSPGGLAFELVWEKPSKDPAKVLNSTPSKDDINVEKRIREKQIAAEERRKVRLFFWLHERMACVSSGSDWSMFSNILNCS